MDAGLIFALAIVVLIISVIVLSVIILTKLSRGITERAVMREKIEGITKSVGKDMDKLRDEIEKIHREARITQGGVMGVESHTQGIATATRDLTEKSSENFHTIDKNLDSIHGTLKGFKMNCAKYVET